jgi:hypothetical protein
VLHWGWEADAGWGELERLASVLSPHAAAWRDFLGAVGRSREGSYDHSVEPEHESSTAAERKAGR